MRNKKYIFMAALLVGIFISVSTKCGTCASPFLSCTKAVQPVAHEYYEDYNPLFLKFLF